MAFNQYQDIAGASGGIASTVKIKDSSGNNLTSTGNALDVNIKTTSQTFGAAFPSTGLAVGFSDGTNMRAAYVAAFHNSDNQVPASSQYGLLTGGIAQILNPSGNLDRQRGTGFDGIPAVGIATGTQQLATSQFTTTFNGAVTGSTSSQTITVASTTNLLVGDMIITSDNLEYAEILTVPTGTTFTAILKNNHANAQNIKWFHYNQARDALGSGDNATGLGVGPSATYLYNNVSAVFEYDRSAKGELDGATGAGTAVAAEYEYNGQPLANGSVLSGFNFDRARNVQAGGLGSGTISNNPLAANSTTLTLNSGPTTLQPGALIVLDRAGANPETNYVGTGYSAGSTTVPLSIATQFSHNQNSTVEWSQHAPLGPQLNGFLPSGLGMEEEIVYDPASKKYFVEIAATADANSGQNIVLENAALYNGSTFDRERGVIGDAQAATGIGADSVMLWNGATYDRLKGDTTNGAYVNIKAQGAGLALDASVTGLQVSQGSTTSGQKGDLVQGAVTTAAPTYVTAQTSPLSLTTSGALRSDITTIAGTAPTTAGKIDVKGADGDVFVRQATAANLNAQVVGPTASGSSLTANPVTVGGLAKTSLPTAVSDAQVVNEMHDKFGRQIIIPGTIRDLVGTQRTTISASTSETTIVTAAANVFNDIVALWVNNTSATAVRVDFRDTTGGTILYDMYIPAGDMRGISLPRGTLPQTSVNTNWTAQSSASVTDLRINVVFEKNK